MLSSSSADPTSEPELTGSDRPRLIIARDLAPIALSMYAAWLAGMLAVWVWAEHRRRRDVERALEALRTHRMAYVPPHTHTAADFRPHPMPADVDGADANVITLPLPQSEHDIHGD